MRFRGGRWLWVWTVVLAGLFASNEARAESAYESDPRTDVFSLTFSPFHLFLPMFEVEGEYKVINGLGVSLIAGYGWPTERLEDEFGESYDVKFDVFEVGTHVIGYPLRRFRSLQLGVEVVYIHVSTSDPVGEYDATGFAGGFAFGPLVGFKWIVGPGFTGFVQLGFLYYALHAEATDSTGATETQDESDIILNLNLNLGWSF
jgi:hypothetical protein